MTQLLFKVTSILAILLSVCEASEIRIAYAYPHRTFDPQKTNWSHDIQINSLIYDAVFSHDPSDRTYAAGGVVTLKQRLSPLEWLFEVKDNVHFHDGHALTTEDIKYSIERLQGMPKSDLFLYADSIQSTSLRGPNQIVIRSKVEDNDLLTKLGKIKVLPAHIDHSRKDAFSDASTIVGSGPFSFIEKKNNTVTLKKHSNYWGAENHWDFMHFTIVEDIEERANLLSEDKVDVIEELNSEYSKLMENRGFRTFSKASRYVHFLLLDTGEHSPSVFNTKMEVLKKNPFHDKRVREAASLVVDRQSAADKFPSGGTPAYQMFPTYWQESSPNLTPYSQDIEKAKQLMQEAGYAEGFVATTPYVWDSHLPFFRDVGDTLSEINIVLNPVKVPRDDFDAQAFKSSIAFTSWGGRNGSPAYTFDALLLPQTSDQSKKIGYYNYGHFNNARFNELVALAKQSSDQAQSMNYYRVASEVAIREQHALIPLFYESENWAYKENLLFSSPPDTSETRPEYFTRRDE